MLPLTICSLFLIAPLAEAALPQLAHEYVQNNATLKEVRNRITSAEWDTTLLKASKTWNLGYTPFHRDDNLQTLSPFSPTSSQTTEHVFSLTKDFEWGGKLILGKRLSHFQQERNSAFFNSNLDTHSFTHEIRYRQNLGADLLGRIFRKEKTISQQRHQLARREYRQHLQGGLLALAQSYANTRLQRSLTLLQREALKRAKAIKNFVRKRVRDGLREKVDLYRAQSNVHLQQEQIYSALKNLDASLERLSSTLHRKVLAGEIEYYRLAPKHKLPQGDPTTHNADIRTLTQRQQILEQQLIKVRHEFFPRISLDLGHKTNAVDDKQSQTWKDGHFFTSKHQAQEIFLAINWPIGNAPQRALRSKLRATQSTIDAQKTRLAQSIALRAEAIKKQIGHLEKNITLSQKRKKLAYNIVNEMNRLYRKGKSNLEQVIRAQEDLIRTQTGFVRHLAERDILYYSLLHLHGTLDQHLLDKGEEHP